MIEKPKKLTFVVHDLFKLRDYLFATKEVSEHDFDEFWHWWIDLRDQRTGPCDGSIRYVPLGFWGWTENAPYKQLTPDEYHAEEVVERALKGKKDDDRPPRKPTDRDRSTYRVLCAMEQFANKGGDDSGDLRVYMTW